MFRKKDPEFAIVANQDSRIVVIIHFQIFIKYGGFDLAGIVVIETNHDIPGTGYPTSIGTLMFAFEIHCPWIRKPAPAPICSNRLKSLRIPSRSFLINSFRDFLGYG
jgi:hypothetical protein